MALTPFISLIPVIKTKIVIIGYNVNSRTYFSTNNSDDSDTKDKLNLIIIGDPENLIYENKYFNLNDYFETTLESNRRKAGVYGFRAQYSTNFYVGSSINIAKRFKEHLNSYDCNCFLQRAFKKYYTTNFYFYVLEEIKKPYRMRE